MRAGGLNEDVACLIIGRADIVTGNAKGYAAAASSGATARATVAAATSFSAGTGAPSGAFRYTSNSSDSSHAAMTSDGPVAASTALSKVQDVAGNDRNGCRRATKGHKDAKRTAARAAAPTARAATTACSPAAARRAQIP